MSQINQSTHVQRSLLQRLSNFLRIRLFTWMVAQNRKVVPALFNTEWYLENHPDVKQSGIQPYVHFHLFGWQMGYRPMPMFDVAWYVEQYPDFQQGGMNPLEHYENIGQHKNYQPNPDFQPEWYLEAYPDVREAGVDPLYHYCYQGWKENRNIAPTTQDQTAVNPPSKGYPVMEMFKSIVSRADATSTLPEAMKILREMPLGDFALLTQGVPAEYPNLAKLLPHMAPEQAQRNWTGNAGLPLLQQTTDFVKSVYMTMCEHGLDEKIETRKILDFGMGWGRIIRLMYWYFEPDNIYAVDPMQSSIDICHEYNVTAHIGKVDNIVTSLPFDEKFDVIYAFSVFTHIADSSAMAAQETLRQHITNDGLLVITIRPIEYWHFARRQETISEDRLNELVAAHNTNGYSFNPHQNRKEDQGGSTYGDATYTFDYIEKHWAGWKIVKVDRNFSDQLQVYVYLKPV